ncbi:MAG: bile acid:sodium symporter family protein [Corynebacterium glucuronolyticum]|nr:bile acid:sodium symporter [Mycobacteriaceae bacterium]MDY5833996.1 bile acid:sodium symporter family protein [Corynebacterium glucuronolyticum]
MLKRLNIDILIVLIIIAVIIAIFFPARGEVASAFKLASSLAIALLFYLYGARLSTSEALAGLKHWRLHLLILAFTFVVFPLIGIALTPLTMFIPHGIYMGILYLTLVPSTVQSSVAFTSIAKGNVAGAIVSASASNLVGVFATPLLVMALMEQSGEFHIEASVFTDIAIQLLLPFVLGQLTRRWVHTFAEKGATKVVDRGSIALVVYVAFSEGMVEGIWSSVAVSHVLFLVVLSIVLVAFMLWLTRFVALKLGFNEEDTIAIEFCGTKKSLATGLPMAAVIFAGQPTALLILPLMIFHQVQLMMCSWLASRYAKRRA